jgi:hypothetical protein
MADSDLLYPYDLVNDETRSAELDQPTHHKVRSKSGER